MPANVAFLVAFSTGFIGAIAVSAVAVRFTRKLRSLAFGGILSGAALGVLVYVSWNWITFGFELIQVCMLPLAVLILLLGAELVRVLRGSRRRVAIVAAGDRRACCDRRFTGGMARYGQRFRVPPSSIDMGRRRELGDALVHRSRAALDRANS
jgi:hypothetical protein